MSITHLKKYCANTSGHFAIWFAIMGLPISAGVTLAVEHLNSQQLKTNMHASLDAAALAAVMNQQLTPMARKTFAEDYFWDNFEGKKNFNVTVSEATEQRVEITASGKISTSVAGALGVKNITISGNAVAVRTIDDTICVLTLNPDGESSFLVDHKATFVATACSVQVNSSHARAAVVDNKSAATAKSFCAHGGTEGLFHPFANSECSIVADPYIDLVSPTPSPCNGLGLEDEVIGTPLYDELNENISDGEDNPGSAAHMQGHAGHFNYRHHNHEHRHYRASGIYDHAHNHKKFQHHSNENENTYDPVEASIGLTVANDAVLFPGTYCDGIKVTGKGVKFMPGQYDVYNGLFFKSGGQSYAEDVVFVFHGTDTELRVEEKAALFVKAPSIGKMAGIAFFHKPKTNETLPIGKNVLKGGGNLEVLGAVYFPYHTIEIGKGSRLASKAPATSYIAYNAHFTEESTIFVESDHQKAGLPPLEPRSDSGARILK